MMVNRVFSGIQPTGTLHLGNYFGAVRAVALLLLVLRRALLSMVFLMLGRWRKSLAVAKGIRDGVRGPKPSMR